MRVVLSLVLSGFFAASPVAASQRLTVVELFTSQGCSSCPPADAFLTELARSRSDLLPLAFHVTYWNSLGWRDPFSFDEATARQYVYSRDLGENSVFTPEMVVDGAKSVAGSDRAAAETAISAARNMRKEDIALRVWREAGGLRIEIGAGRGTARVVIAGFDPVHRTSVGRGENGGRVLTESNIVRAIRDVGGWTGGAQTIVAARPQGEDAAVLLQGPDGAILAAARL